LKHCRLQEKEKQFLYFALKYLVFQMSEVTTMARLTLFLAIYKTGKSQYKQKGYLDALGSVEQAFGLLEAN